MAVLHRPVRQPDHGRDGCHHCRPGGRRGGPADLISTRSYHGTSTLHIAERAGLSQATLFKYFKTKDDLLTAILHPVVPGIFGSFFEELLAFETTEERVRYLVHDRMSYLKKNRALMKIILQESFSNKKLKNERSIGKVIGRANKTY